MAPVLAVLALASASACAPRLYPTAVVAGPVVRLGDVADVSCLPTPLARRAAVLPVGRLAGGAGVTVLSGEDIAVRLRAGLPRLADHLGGLDGARVVVRREATVSKARVPTCLRVLRAIPGGAALPAADLEPAACDGEPARIAYDRLAGLARAIAPLAPGDLVRAPPATTLSDVRAGDPLTVQVSVGPVRVERQVAAVRAARPGAAILVRGAAGGVFAAPPPRREPEA